MFREKCAVLENRKVAPQHYVLKLRSPRIAKNAAPGQFVQILSSESMDPLLPRPFSFLTATAKDFSILYHVVGKGTQFLSEKKKGECLWVLGPCGNGFSQDGKKTAVLVGGGVGIPPLYHLAIENIKRKKWLRENVHVFLGARNKSLLLCEKDFLKLGVSLHLATDDGSKGKKGFVTSIFENFLKDKDLMKTRAYTCGPTLMLKAVSLISQKYSVSCEVSVEVPMACGFGACLGCAIEVKGQKVQEGSRFAIACCEGPVFQGESIVWH